MIRYRLTFALTFFLALCALPARSQTTVSERPPELDLFLCIGQSNMAGRASLEPEKGDLEPISNVYLLTPDGKWEPAKNPLNRHSSIRYADVSTQRLNPAYAFAKKVAATTGRPIGLVCNARGGSSILSWEKGHRDRYYDEAIRRAKQAHPAGTFKAIIWHQGEQDVETRLEEYPDRLKRLVADFRKDLDSPELFFAAGEIAHWITDRNIAAFNEMIRKIETFIPNSGHVRADGLAPIGGDRKDPHFDRKSMLILGDRYADVVLERVYKTSSEGKSQ